MIDFLIPFLTQALDLIISSFSVNFLIIAYRQEVSRTVKKFQKSKF